MDDFLLTHDAALILKVGTQRVRQLEENGEISSIRTAGGWRLFRRGDVERLAKKRQRTPVPGRRVLLSKEAVGEFLLEHCGSETGPGARKRQINHRR